jgi:hypothetical protein
MPVGDPIPQGSPDAPEVIQAAFAGGPYGDHNLYAVVDGAEWLTGPPARATGLPIDRHLAIEGRFFVDGVPAGEFRRALYRLGGEWELWLGGLEWWQVHHGRGTEFQERNLEVARAVGVRRARLNAGRIGSYLWARRDFDFDDRRLPGWGTIMGVGFGGYRVVLPSHGEPEELREALVRELINAAYRSRQIIRVEAAVARRLGATTPLMLARPDLSLIGSALVSLPRRRRDADMSTLSRRLLINRSWPGVRDLAVPTAATPLAAEGYGCDR